MNEVKQVGAFNHVGAIAEQALERCADKQDLAEAVAQHGDHLRFFGQRTKAPLAQRDQIIGVQRLGDVLNGAFVVKRLALGVAHQMRSRVLRR